MSACANAKFGAQATFSGMKIIRFTQHIKQLVINNSSKMLLNIRRTDNGQEFEISYSLSFLGIGKSFCFFQTSWVLSLVNVTQSVHPDLVIYCFPMPLNRNVIFDR